MGVVAFGESFLIRSGGWEVDDSLGTADEEVSFDGSAAAILGRLASGELGLDGAAWLCEGGVVGRVMP